MRKKIIKKKKKVWQLNKPNSEVFRCLFSINKKVWEAYKDMCLNSNPKKVYSKEVTNFMLSELKKYYNGDLSKILHLDEDESK